MKGLLDFYGSRADYLDPEHPDRGRPPPASLWHRVLKSCLGERGSNRVREDVGADVELLASGIREQSVEGPRDYLSLLQNFVSLAIIRQLRPETLSLSLLRDLHSTLAVRCVWRGFSAGEAFHALGTSLAGLAVPEVEPHPLPEGEMLPDREGHAVDGAVPHPVLASDSALVWLFLGRRTGNVRFVRAAASKMVHALSLFDRKGEPFFGVGTREGEFDLVDFLSSHLLLFSSFLPIRDGRAVKVEAIICRLTELLDRSAPESVLRLPVFRPLLALAMNLLPETSLLPGDLLPEGSVKGIDPDTGRVAVSSEEIDLVCTFTGVNTGIGAFKKGSIHIVSFGPHFSPLADCSHYGQYRSVLKGASLPDPEYVRREKSFAIGGWIRPVSKSPSHICVQNMTMTQPGDSWLRFTVSGNEEEVVFTAKFLIYKEEEDPIYFVYFVLADVAHIDKEDPLFPGTLDGYRGNLKKVRFKRGDDTLRFAPQRVTAAGEKKEGRMEVIPLTGGAQHFWGADFLVALPFYEAREKHVAVLS
ncbi:MAG: hypothetical protein OXF02_00055 [Simkaniaceae bacterium]|nr:hypothetical protein [Simkaniaceae bacterium]